MLILRKLASHLGGRNEQFDKLAWGTRGCTVTQIVLMEIPAM